MTSKEGDEMSETGSDKIDGKVYYLTGVSSAWNVEDTSDEEPPAEDNGSWTSYWMRKTGLARPTICPACGAVLDDENEAGAHIRLANEEEDEWAWITVLCDGCNNWQNKNKMTIDADTRIVRVKMSKKRKTAKCDSKTS